MGGLSKDVLSPAAAAIVCLRVWVWVCVCVCLGVPHMLTSSSNRGVVGAHLDWLGVNGCSGAPSLSLPAALLCAGLRMCECKCGSARLVQNHHGSCSFGSAQLAGGTAFSTLAFMHTQQAC